VLVQGEEGEVFFIIESGSVICKNLPGDQSNNILTAGDYFGERSLLKAQPRCCDVEAMNDVSLIALHKEDFQTYLANVVELFEYNMGMRLLLCMPLIGTLPEDSRNEVFAQLSVASYNAGAVIAAQGKPADSFFIVKDGNIVVRHTSLGTSSSNSGSSGSLSGRGKDVHHSDVTVLDPGHWFPDKEFDAASPLLHSFVARGDCQVFVLDRSTYVRHVASHKAKLIADGRLKVSHLGPGSATAQRGAEASAGAGRTQADDGAPRSGAGAHPQPSAAISKPRDARRFSTEHKLGAPTAAADFAMPSTRKPLGIPLSELELKATVGTGTFGRVRLAFHRKTNRTFALKMLQKNQIVRLKQQSNIMNERDILLRMDHPFIIKLYDTYKDRDRLYMLLEIVQVCFIIRLYGCASIPVTA
jgi:CRP-like cAMP-binding protein